MRDDGSARADNAFTSVDAPRPPLSWGLVTQLAVPRSFATTSGSRVPEPCIRVGLALVSHLRPACPCLP
jgi:hypothetical protein